MLLIDKVANRATKQTIDDAQATMNLPLMLMQKRDVVHQVTAMKSVLGEAMLQLGNLKGIDQVTFLGDIVFVRLSSPTRAFVLIPPRQ
jgi:hypothetical protein